MIPQLALALALALAVALSKDAKCHNLKQSSSSMATLFRETVTDRVKVLYSMWACGQLYREIKEMELLL